MASWETFQAAYQNASPATKELLDSEQIAGVVDDIGKRSETDIDRQELLIVISDYILGLIEKSDLQEALKKVLDESSSSAILSRINNLNPGGVPVSPNNPVVPVRTMEDDKASVQGEQTFSSSQDAILGQIPKPPES